MAVVQAANHVPTAINDNDFFLVPSSAKVELGKMLFYNKIISCNSNISCATCHHLLTGTGDGLTLPVSEGGKGLGDTRDTSSGSDAVHERVPGNASHVFIWALKNFPHTLTDNSFLDH